MPDSLIAASLIVCESTIVEKAGERPSAIRIMDTLRIPLSVNHAHFTTLAIIYSKPGDFSSHSATVHMQGMRNGNWTVVATAPAHQFAYGYKIDINSPGGMILTTEFSLDLTTFGALGLFYIQLILDGALKSQVPLTLLRI